MPERPYRVATFSRGAAEAMREGERDMRVPPRVISVVLTQAGK
jgi:hypothetical protein